MQWATCGIFFAVFFKLNAGVLDNIDYVYRRFLDLDVILGHSYKLSFVVGWVDVLGLQKDNPRN